MSAVMPVALDAAQARAITAEAKVEGDA